MMRTTVLEINVKAYNCYDLMLLQFPSVYLSEGFDGDYVVRGWVSLHQTCLCQCQDAFNGFLEEVNRKQNGYVIMLTKLTVQYSI